MVTGLVWAKLDRVSTQIVCRACGRTTGGGCVIGESPCLAPSDDADYLIDAAEIVFWGRCPDCRRNRTTPNTQ